MSGAMAGPLGDDRPRPLARVVDLFGHRAAREDRPGKTPVAPVTPRPESAAITPEQRLAISIEALFLRRDLSLSDPETAAAFGVAIDAVLLVLDGALANGQIEAESHQFLGQQMQALLSVPDSL
ncbi:hypothetical protein ACIPW9_36565 [Streptomyces sp. NPDC090052]|uniref:hypothetical protein n=1 Tax=Streptomyces sp. NPDC090052 TaxID=3365931 RepID=UPI0037FEAF38